MFDLLNGEKIFHLDACGLAPPLPGLPLSKRASPSVVGRHTRTWFVAILLGAGIWTHAHAHQDRIDHARTISVAFTDGEVAEYALNEGRVSAITLRYGTTALAVPPDVCSKLHDIHFASTQLLWDGRSRRASESDYVYLIVEFGTEADRLFGRFPEVALYFGKEAYHSAQRIVPLENGGRRYVPLNPH